MASIRLSMGCALQHIFILFITCQMLAPLNICIDALVASYSLKPKTQFRVFRMLIEVATIGEQQRYAEHRRAATQQKTAERRLRSYLSRWQPSQPTEFFM